MLLKRSIAAFVLGLTFLVPAIAAEHAPPPPRDKGLRASSARSTTGGPAPGTEVSRTPYQFEIDGRSCDAGLCWNVFPKVPKGKRLEIKHASCMTWTTGGSVHNAYFAYNARAGNWLYYMQSGAWTRTDGAGDTVQTFSQPMSFYVPQLKWLYFQFEFSGSNNGATCTITGDLVTLQ